MRAVARFDIGMDFAPSAPHTGTVFVDNAETGRLDHLGRSRVEESYTGHRILEMENE